MVESEEREDDRNFGEVKSCVPRSVADRGASPRLKVHFCNAGALGASWGRLGVKGVNDIVMFSGRNRSSGVGASRLFAPVPRQPKARSTAQSWYAGDARPLPGCSPAQRGQGWASGRRGAFAPPLPERAFVALCLLAPSARRYPRLEPRGADCAARLKRGTLTNLYKERPALLDRADKKFDAAVAAAYGWPVDLTDEQILERLLALNLARAAEEQTASKVKIPKTSCEKLAEEGT
jgi:hypothetical protein